MLLSQVFDDLNEFVATYRGLISRDGILLHTDTLYEEGTVLGVEITLSESLPLIRGTAGVVQLMKGQENSRAPYSAVLEFLQLDEESEAFLDRLTERFEAEGVEPFHLEQVVEKGRRGIRRQSGSFRLVSGGLSDAEMEPRSGAVDATDQAAGTGRHTDPGSRRSTRPWLLVVAAIVVVVAGYRVAIDQYGLDPLAWLRHASDTGPPARTQASVIEAERRTVDASSVTGSAAGVAVRDENEPDYPETPPEVEVEVVSELPPATRIESIEWHEAGAYTVVTVEADGRIDDTLVRNFRMNEVPQSRMVLYLYGVGPGNLSYKTQVDGKQLAAVRVWFHEEKSPVQLHIVLDLASQDVVAFKPVVEGHRLVVTLGPRE